MLFMLFVNYLNFVIYIYIYIYIYDMFIYLDSNADISEKSKIRYFFCITFYSQYFWNLKITENMCDHTVEYWQLSIHLCQFFNFLLHVAGKCHHFLRFNYMEMCSFHVYLHICQTLVHSCTGSAIFGIQHSKFKKSFVTHIFSLFLTKHL